MCSLRVGFSIFKWSKLWWNREINGELMPEQNTTTSKTMECQPQTAIVTINQTPTIWNKLRKEPHWVWDPINNIKMSHPACHNCSRDYIISYCYILTLKAPSNICSRTTFIFFLFFRENKQMIHMKCQDVFYPNKKCHLLQLWLAL